MEHNVDYKYYIIEFTKQPPYENIDKYICIPDAWIILRDVTTQYAVVKYPVENKAQTKERVERGENFSVEWSIYEVDVKYGTDSYNDAKNHIKALNKLFVQEGSNPKGKKLLTPENQSCKYKTSVPFNSKTNKPETSVSPFNCVVQLTTPNVIETKRTITDLNIGNRKKQDLSTGSVDKVSKHFTRYAHRLSQSSKLNSLEQNTFRHENIIDKSKVNCIENSANSRGGIENKLNDPDLINESVNPRIILPTTEGASFSDQLNEICSHFEQSSVAPFGHDVQLTAPNVSSRTPVTNPNIENCKKQHQSAESAEEVSKYFTRQARRISQSLRFNSMDQNNLTQEKAIEKSIDYCIENSRGRRENESNVNPYAPDLTKESLNPKIIRPPVFGPSFLTQLNDMHSHYEKTYLMFDRMRLAYIQKCSLIKDMINMVQNYDNLDNNDSAKTSENVNNNDFAKTSENAITTVIEEKQDKEKESKILKGTTAKPQVRNRMVNPGEEKDNIDNKEEERKVEDDDNNTDDEKEVYPKKIRGEPRMFTLPPEYNVDDSRWTLRYPEKTDQLEELLPSTRIYVNSIRLKNCLRVSKDSKTLARMLLMEIFTENALRTCSLTGKKANAFSKDETDIRPGLDEEGRAVLLRFVASHALENNWGSPNTTNILNTLRNKIQDMRGRIQYCK